MLNFTTTVQDSLLFYIITQKHFTNVRYIWCFAYCFTSYIWLMWKDSSSGVIFTIHNRKQLQQDFLNVSGYQLTITSLRLEIPYMSAASRFTDNERTRVEVKRRPMLMWIYRIFLSVLVWIWLLSTWPPSYCNWTTFDLWHLSQAAKFVIKSISTCQVSFYVSAVRAWFSPSAQASVSGLFSVVEAGASRGLAGLGTSILMLYSPRSCMAGVAGLILTSPRPKWVGARPGSGVKGSPTRWKRNSRRHGG